jgi:hypothetical protein
MSSNYLNIPISFKEIKQHDTVDRIDLKRSIHNMIHLITTTEYDEVRYDPEFGCDIWQHDFENIYNPHSFREDLKRSIKNSIEKNEKRLTNVRVDLQIEQAEIATKVNNKRIKTRIRLIVKGIVDETNETFEHQETFFIGPLSY